MLGFILDLAIIVLGLISIVLYFFILLAFVYMIFKVWKVCIRSVLVNAELTNSQLVHSAYEKRDYLHDRMETEYRPHLFGPDEIIHRFTKAYKTITGEYYDCYYRYVVNDYEYFVKSAEVPDKSIEDEPARFKPIYYVKKRPEKYISQEDFLTLIKGYALVVTVFLVLNLFTDVIRMRITDYAFFACVYAGLFFVFFKAKSKRH